MLFHSSSGATYLLFGKGLGERDYVTVCACPVPLVRVWLIHETEFVCGMPARHSCGVQIRKEW